MPEALTLRISRIAMKLIFGFPRPAWVLMVFLALAGCEALPREHSQNAPVERTILPLQEPGYPPISEIDVRKATAPPRFEVKAPNCASATCSLGSGSKCSPSAASR